METRRDLIFRSIQSLGLKVLPSGTRLILFGSQARNDAHEESDWDLLILLNDDQTNQDAFSTYAYPFVELGWEYGTYFSPKIYTRSEWSRRRGTPFYENIAREGVVLC
ncbi:MAG: nucleotidyltransferase domain-containing protein [Paludibacteraceae bacterium]|nr:nucleotidyltransferase domain-containing protein [Paludibacteraceae bacterium]MBR3519064.1 nucleotidyltransferase domain-containing protein [Paludibacteraceae bacterium]